MITNGEEAENFGVPSFFSGFLQLSAFLLSPLGRLPARSRARSLSRASPTPLFSLLPLLRSAFL